MRNRTQEEVAAREPLSRVRAREAQFFSQHSELSSLVGSGILGMQALEKRLVGIQAECLAAAMPRLKRKVGDARVKAEKELAGMRGSCSSDSEAVLLFSERVNAVQVRLVFSFSFPLFCQPSLRDSILSADALRSVPRRSAPSRRRRRGTSDT